MGLLKWLDDTVGKFDEKLSDLEKAITSPPSEDPNTPHTQLIFDISGSMKEMMNGKMRIEWAVDGGKRFCSTLETRAPKTRVCLVAFSEKGYLVSGFASPAAIAKELPKLIKLTVNEGKKTNMSNGFITALDEIKRVKSRLLSWVIMTDGHNNEGADPVVSARGVKEVLKVSINVIGFAEFPSDVNESELRKIATTYNDKTQYWFCKNASEFLDAMEEVALHLAEVDS